MCRNLIKLLFLKKKKRKSCKVSAYSIREEPLEGQSGTQGSYMG
jgi:hypothetical protein